ncbi:nuclear transport factor 2 family protein [Rhodanobacter sp. Col0626]|uniref:nuclear transport factor 2 family protein n=1 Tax=Rhodanobacter sp. Col0626 TaxID=3415679 RepID=UPI003CEFBCFB
MRKQYFLQVGMTCLAVLALGAGTAFAAAAAAAAGANGVDESARSKAAVIAVDQHWLEAELDGDTAWLNEMLLPEYRSVDADGAVHAKATIVAHAAKNRGNDEARRKVEAWLKANPSGKSVTIRGNTAIISFYDLAKGADKDVRSSDVFVYVDGRWHGLYSQHSKVSAG